MTRKVIPTNKVCSWLELVDSVKRFSLANKFSGELEGDLSAIRGFIDLGSELYIRTDAHDEFLLRGGVTVGADLWFEITFTSTPKTSKRKPKRNKQENA